MAFNYNRAFQVWAVPLLLVAFFAYLVAHSFLSVFETVLDALFLCFAVDLETNDGSSEKPYFMDQEFLVSKHFISSCNVHARNLSFVKLHTQKRLISSLCLLEGSEASTTSEPESGIWAELSKAEPTSLSENLLPGEVKLNKNADQMDS